MKNKILTLIENYSIWEDPFDNLFEKVEYEIKGKKEKKLLNKIVHLENKDKYFKILQTFEDNPCNFCKLLDKEIESCQCLIDYKNTDLDTKKYKFYFEELNKYEVLFGGD